MDEISLGELDALIKEVCPIEGINSDGKIFLLPEATKEQAAAALSVLEENWSRLNLKKL